MNSGQAVAMDMPSRDVLAMAMAGIADPSEFTANRGRDDGGEQERPSIASRQRLPLRILMQIFRAGAQDFSTGLGLVAVRGQAPK
jgi:cell division protein FtsI/penicillin-binding protein 2